MTKGQVKEIYRDWNGEITGAAQQDNSLHTLKDLCEGFGDGNRYCSWEKCLINGEYVKLRDFEEKHEEEERERIFSTIRKEADTQQTRSAWARGVNLYAHDLIDELEEAINGGWFDADDLNAPRLVEKALLNGADNWKQFSWGGCSLVYDKDIALRLCTPSELKKTHNGQRRPNEQEEWFDTQARALYQAARIVMNAVKKAVTA